MKDKVVLAAGGSSGIGRDTGGEARFVQADVSVPADVARLVAETVTVHGRLDAAFNNAAAVEGVSALSFTN